MVVTQCVSHMCGGGGAKRRTHTLTSISAAGGSYEGDAQSGLVLPLDLPSDAAATRRSMLGFSSRVMAAVMSRRTLARPLGVRALPASSVLKGHSSAWVRGQEARGG